jgi:hypothetical protein
MLHDSQKKKMETEEETIITTRVKFFLEILTRSDPGSGRRARYYVTPIRDNPGIITSHSAIKRLIFWIYLTPTNHVLSFSKTLTPSGATP